MLSWCGSIAACRWPLGGHGIIGWILVGLGGWLLAGYWVARAIGTAVKDDEKLNNLTLWD
jgi:hypothetical protein